MKYLKKFLSVALIMGLILSSMIVTVDAASTSKGYVHVDVVQNYKEVNDVLTAMNKERKKAGLKPVKLDKELCELAVKRAAETTIYMDAKHTRPDGTNRKTISSRLIRENWCSGYKTGISAVKDGWMPSSSHKKNLLFKTAKCVGIAFVTAGNGRRYCDMIISETKVKSEMTKRSGTKKYTIKVDALLKYLKKSLFRLEIWESDGTPYYLDYVNEREEYQMTPMFDTIGWGYESVPINTTDFTWSTSNKLVANVTNTGKLIANNRGDVTITCVKKTAPEVKMSLKLHVKPYSCEEEIDEYYDDPYYYGYDFLNDPYFADFPEYFFDVFNNDEDDDEEDIDDDVDEHVHEVCCTNKPAGIFRKGHTDHKYCEECLEVFEQGQEIPAINHYDVTFGSLKYTGKPKTAASTTFRAGNRELVEGEDYTVKYSNNTNAGTATITYTFKGNYSGSFKDFFYIEKASNTMTAKAKTATVKYSGLKKKNQTVAAKTAFAVSKAIGSLTYKKTSGNSKITVASSGKITVKKGLKKGTYKINVKITAAGNKNYKSASKNVTVTIKVK